MNAASRLKNFGPDGWDNAARRRAAGVSAGYSWFVRIARLALPVAALVIVGIVVARLAINPEQQEQISNLATATTPEETRPGQIEMIGAKYEGVDVEGRAYTVMAEKAERAMQNPDAVTLTAPRADITLQDGSWLALRALDGLYDNAGGTLRLTGDVVIFQDEGYELRLQEIDIDLKARTARSDKPVAAQGPAGELRGEALQVLEAGDVIVFGGPVHLVLRRMEGDKG